MASLAVQSHADEYSDDHIVPVITAVVFTPHHVAVRVNPALVKEMLPEAEHRTRFFLAPRTDYEFKQISERRFSELLGVDHVFRQFGARYGGRNLERERGIEVETPDETCDLGESVPTVFKSGNVTVPVELKCHSSLTDAAFVHGDLWLASYIAGGHGVYSVDGVMVVAPSGEIKARIKTSEYPPVGLAHDPWSTEMWVFTDDRIATVSDNYTVHRQYWPVHQFDEELERPDVFLIASPIALESRSLAILAYTLGEKHYEKFYRAIKDIPADEISFSLYDYVMSRTEYRPGLPLALNALLSDAEPTYSWRKFVCMLDDEKAERLCASKLEEWPVTLR